MNLFIVAGEASAELHAAALVRALKREAPDSHFFGAGGTALREQGVEVVVDAKSLSIVGITDWFDKLGEVWASYRTLIKLMETRELDAAILLDLPDLNLLLAKKLKRKKIPVIYYISPQVWAWRTYRISKIKRLVDLMLVILPFEREFYEKRGVPAEFVGHPLLDSINAKMSYRSQAEILAGPRIAVLPGSRHSEIKYHAPILGEVIGRIRLEYPNAVFQVPVASTLSDEFVAEQIPNLRESLNPRTTDVLHWCDLALVASGTATLETALTVTPFCLFYRVSRSSIWIFNTFARYRGFIGIPNLLLEQEVVREFLQERMTADNLFDEAKRLIVDPNYRDKMISGLRQCRQKLGAPGASHRAAAHILSFLKTIKQTDPALIYNPVHA